MLSWASYALSQTRNQEVQPHNHTSAWSSGLGFLSVTQEVAGSNPVALATKLFFTIIRVLGLAV